MTSTHEKRTRSTSRRANRSVATPRGGCVGVDLLRPLTLPRGGSRQRLPSMVTALVVVAVPFEAAGQICPEPGTFECSPPGTAIPCVSACGTTGRSWCAADCTFGPCEAPPESCGTGAGNGVDDDCDGETDEGCTAPLIEVCDGLDNDDDGLTDEGFDCILGTVETCTTACDSDGQAACVRRCGWSQCFPPPETCNGADDDCDGLTDEGCGPCTCVDEDHDGYFSTDCGDANCSPRTDCDDANPRVHPGAGETCNGVDDDCNGQTDEVGDCPGHGLTAFGGCSCSLTDGPQHGWWMVAFFACVGGMALRRRRNGRRARPPRLGSALLAIIAALLLGPIAEARAQGSDTMQVPMALEPPISPGLFIGDVCGYAPCHLGPAPDYMIVLQVGGAYINRPLCVGHEPFWCETAPGEHWGLLQTRAAIVAHTGPLGFQIDVKIRFEGAEGTIGGLESEAPGSFTGGGGFGPTAWGIDAAVGGQVSDGVALAGVLSALSAAGMDGGPSGLLDAPGVSAAAVMQFDQVGGEDVTVRVQAAVRFLTTSGASSLIDYTTPTGQVVIGPEVAWAVTDYLALVAAGKATIPLDQFAYNQWGLDFLLGLQLLDGIRTFAPRMPRDSDEVGSGDGSSRWQVYSNATAGAGGAVGTELGGSGTADAEGLGELVFAHFPGGSPGPGEIQSGPLELPPVWPR